MEDWPVAFELDERMKMDEAKRNVQAARDKRVLVEYLRLRNEIYSHGALTG